MLNWREGALRVARSSSRSALKQISVCGRWWAWIATEVGCGISVKHMLRTRWSRQTLAYLGATSWKDSFTHRALGFSAEFVIYAYVVFWGQNSTCVAPHAPQGNREQAMTKRSLHSEFQLESASDRAEKYRKTGNVRVPLDSIGFCMIIVAVSDVVPTTPTRWPGIGGQTGPSLPDTKKSQSSNATKSALSIIGVGTAKSASQGR